MAYIIKIRRGLASEWTDDNPVLRQGEPGYERVTGKFKIGDGIQHWNDLPYFVTEDVIADMIAAAIAVIEVAAGVTIDDLSTTATTKTYSVAKIKSLNDSQDAVIAGKAATSHTHTMSQITDAATKAEDSVVVKLSGPQTISGVKTFNSAPVVPDGSFSIVKVSGLQAAIDAKAVIADSSLTTATTTTYSANKINSAIATAIAALVGTAPSILDTLGEISDALNDDANVVTTLTSALADKQPLNSNLTAIAGLTPTIDNFLQAKAGTWASRTVAQVKADLGLTGTNSGDQSSIVGITGTKAQFDTAVTDGNFVYADDVISFTDEAAQDAVGTILTDTATIDLVYIDATPAITADVKDDSITYAKIQNVSATSRVLGRKTTGSGDVEELTATDIRTLISLQADLDTKQPLDSDLTTIAALTATTDSFLQAKAGAWAARTIAQVKTDLGLTGTNTGDQTSIVGITGTKAQFNTAVTDGDIVYVGDITQYTDEAAQDAIGAMVADTATVDLTYVDGTPALTADVIRQMSIGADASGLKLVGDSATPGNAKLYGTDSSGVKGWYAQPSGGAGVSDGDKGDIVISSSGNVYTIDNDVVTYAKMQNVSATSRVLGRKTTGAGDVEELTPTDLRVLAADPSVINVKLAPYNATGDGSTSDQTALSNVASTAVSGDTVYFPGGTNPNYKLTSGLTFADGVKIVGGPGARIFGNFSGNILNVGSNTTVEGLIIENQHTETIDVNISANATKVRLYRLTLKGSGHGVYAGSSGISDVKVIDCTFLNSAYGWLSNGGTGTMAYDLRDVTIDNCRFSVQADAIEFNHPTTASPVAGNFTITNNSITIPDEGIDAPSAGFGIGLANVCDGVVEGNRLVNIRNQGIHIEDDCDNIIIRGNVVKNVDGTLASLPASQNVGISIAKSTNITVDDNHVSGCRGNGFEMIFNGTLINDHLTITNNSSRDNDSGFSLYGTPPGGHITVVGNRAFDNADNGFEFGGQAAIQLAYNQSFNNGGWGMYRPGGNDGYLSNFRENLIYGNTTGDINGAVLSAGGPTVLYDRSVQLSGTTGGGGTGLGYPAAFRLGAWAQGRVHISVRTSSARFEKTEDVTWDGTTFKTATVRSDGYGVLDTKCHSMVNGVLAIEIYTATNQAYRASVRFDGLIFETSETFSGTVTATALSSGYQPLDSDLTTIAGLTATTDSFMQAKSGAWAARTIAQVKTDLGLTGTNSGDQTSIVGITGTKAQFNTAVTDGDIVYVGDVVGVTDGDKGDITVSSSGTTYTIDNDVVTYAKMQNVSATSRILGRKTAGAGDPEELTGSDVRTIAGTATTDTPQFAGIEVGHASDTTLARSAAGLLSVEGVVIPTISSTHTLTNKTLTSPVINTPTGIVKGDVGLGNVDNTADTAKPVSTAQQTALDGKQPLDSDLTTIAGLTATTDSFLQAKASAWAVRTIAQVKTDLGLTGTNSGDQTTIVGITGTKAQFDTAVTDGNILYVGDVTQYTDEAAQDAVGAMIVDTNTIDLTYVDATPALTGDVRMQMSITSDASGVKLSGDSATPGNSKLYGTDGSGVKGWYAQPSGGSVSDGDKGDITVSGSGATWTVDNDVVTYAKMQNVSATSRVLGRITAAAGDVEELTGAQLRTIEGTATTDSPQFTGIELGHATDTTIARVSAGVISVEGKNVALNGTGEALTTGTIELGNASDTTLSRSAAGVLAVEGVAIPSVSGAVTLTNKRVTPRTGTTTSSATPSINTDTVDFYSITALAANITSMTSGLSGTPTDGQTLWIAITGTAARTIAWGTSFEASTVALPTTTVSTNRLDVGFVWNAATSKWRCVAVA